MGKQKTSIVLRTCAPDMTSHGGFRWPTEGPVAAPDWKPTSECGNGLHGLLWGEGNGRLLNWAGGAVWLLVEVPSDTIIDLGGKVKFPAGNVIFAGPRHDAIEQLCTHPETRGRAVVGGTATAGDEGTATAGYRGTATAGYRGTATAGDRGTATAGHEGTAKAGYRGTATAGHEGTAKAGYRGTATAGYRGTATAGDRGTATAGHEGTAKAGDEGTATAGYRGTATAGHEGVLVIHHYDATKGRYTLRVAQTGIDGIEPNVAYRLDHEGRFVKAKG